MAGLSTKAGVGSRDTAGSYCKSYLFYFQMSGNLQAKICGPFAKGLKCQVNVK